MSTKPNEEMDAALDELGIPAEGDEPIINADPPELEPEPIEPEPPEEDDPPGYITYEKWIESGKDPDDWQGKNKYEQQYDLIQNNKEFKSDLKNLTHLMKTTVDATTQLQEERYQQGLAEARAELAEALENNDAQGAVNAQNKINLTPQPTSAPQVDPAHNEFYEANPVLDQGSSEFDQEVKAEFVRIYNGKLNSDGVGEFQQLSERAVKGYMKQAMESAKSLFPEKFESNRNSRRTTTGKNKRSTQTPDPVDAIKNVKITTKNPRDTNALMDTYNHILNMKGGGKEDADAFAKAMGVKL